MPEGFSLLDLGSKAAEIHRCHERSVDEKAQCSARQAELAAWIKERIKKEPER